MEQPRIEENKKICKMGMGYKIEEKVATFTHCHRSGT